MKRRKFIGGGVGAIAAVAAICRVPSVFAEGERTKKGAMILLHTNDLHGHLTEWQSIDGTQKGKTVGGIACLATAVKKVRRESEAVLLVDAGDLIGDTMIADLTKGEALVSLFNSLDYDAMTFGNHEPDFGVQVLRQRVEQAQFPFVAANLHDRAGAPFTRPYVINQVGGVPVGVLGLAYPKTPWTTAPKNVEDLTFEDPVVAVKRELPKLRQEGAQLIVVLSHLGLAGDKHLAAAVDGIDIIVGGHSHNRMEQAERVGKTLIVQAGAHGSDLGRLDIKLDGGKISEHKHALIPLEHDSFPPDEKVSRKVAQILAPFSEALNEPIGTARDWLIRAQTVAGQQARKRDEESPVDSLFADIVREELSGDISFLPGVGYGVPIPPGPVTAAQLRQLVPHEGKLVTMTLSGSQVHEVLEQAIENVFTNDPRMKVGGMIQISGLRFSYDSSPERGSRVTHVDIGDQRLKNDASYRVVTNSMLASGGHNQQTLKHGKDVQEHGSQYDTIKEWFRRHSSIETPKLGRILAEKTAARSHRQSTHQERAS